MLDEKGRLFGRVNVIDLAVVLVIVLLAAAYLYREKGSTSVTAAPSTVRLKVVCYNAYPGVAESLHVGDQLVAGGALVPVYIKDIRVRPANNATVRADGTMLLTTNPFRQDIDLVLEGKSTAVGPAEITLGGQKVRAGIEDYVLKTRLVELKAAIVAVEVEP